MIASETHIFINEKRQNVSTKTVNSPQKTTVLLADDHPSTRMGIRALLAQASDIEIVGEAQCGAEVYALMMDIEPKILILDVVMPSSCPNEVINWVRKNHPETVTLILTSHDDHDAYLAATMEAGAVGYLSKSKWASQLINDIRRAARGEILFSNEQVLRATRWREQVGNKLYLLTSREKEILKMLAKGLDNKEIAHALNITVKTAMNHITNLMTKIQVHSRQRAAIWGLKHLSDQPGYFPYGQIVQGEVSSVQNLDMKCIIPNSPPE